MHDAPVPLDLTERRKGTYGKSAHVNSATSLVGMAGFLVEQIVKVMNVVRPVKLIRRGPLNDESVPGRNGGTELILRELHLYRVIEPEQSACEFPTQRR